MQLIILKKQLITELSADLINYLYKTTILLKKIIKTRFINVSSLCGVYILCKYTLTSTLSIQRTAHPLAGGYAVLMHRRPRVYTAGKTHTQHHTLNRVPINLNDAVI